MNNDAYLHLSTGETLKGKRFGAKGERLGELVFTSGMTGYLETLTDPRHFGQIVVQTFPLIGNYGVITEDFESDKIHASAYIVREWCEAPSNFRSEGSIDALLSEQGVPGLCGVDTRCITRLLRESGAAVNALICDKPELSDSEKKALASHRAANAVEAVSCKAAYQIAPENARFKVAVIDYGVNKSLLKALAGLGCALTVFPYDTPASEILSQNIDGAVLSGGPGGPADNPGAIANIRALTEAKLPLLAVGLGHQMLALSQDAKAYRLPYGHRGANQPVRDDSSGRVYITCQNHGCAIDAKTLPEGIKARFINIHDESCEGLAYDNIPAVSVQFFPEAGCGFVLEEFAALMTRM